MSKKYSNPVQEFYDRPVKLLLYHILPVKKTIPLVCDCYKRDYDESAHKILDTYSTNPKCSMCGGKGWHKKGYDVWIVNKHLEEVRFIDHDPETHKCRMWTGLQDFWPQGMIGDRVFFTEKDAMLACNDRNKEFNKLRKKMVHDEDLRKVHGKVYFREGEWKYGYFTEKADHNDVWLNTHPDPKKKKGA